MIYPSNPGPSYLLTLHGQVDLKYNFGHKIVPEGLKKAPKGAGRKKKDAILATKPNRSICL